MRIRASFTLENSVLIPLFTLIIVALSLLAFLLHDHVIIKNSCFQTAIVMNDSSFDMNSTKQVEQSEQKSLEYIQSKSIFIKRLSINFNLTSDRTDISTSGYIDRIPFLNNSDQIERTITVKKAQYLKLIRAARLINHTLNVQNDNEGDK